MFMITRLLRCSLAFLMVLALGGFAALVSDEHDLAFGSRNGRDRREPSRSLGQHFQCGHRRDVDD